MPHADDATLQDHEGRTVLRLERTYRHSVDRVWRALTAVDELPAWHPTPFDLEPRVGGAVRFLTREELPAEREPPGMPDGVVTAYEPPRLLAHTWGDDEVRWELGPHDDGCRLVLFHTFDDRNKGARDATGWTFCLDALQGSLDDGAKAPSSIDRGLPSEWDDVNAAYEERFGIDHAAATPPPPER